MPEPDERTMLNRIESIARIGRNYGIGWSMFSQRPQEVHKKVLNQAGTLFAFRTIGKHERAALRNWVDDNAQTEAQAGLLDGLSLLETGVARVWSPSFLKIAQEVRIGERRTYVKPASSIGDEGAVRPTQLAPVDLEKLRELFATTVEQVKSEDPKVLRAKLSAAENRIVELSKAKPAQEVQRIEVQVLDRAELARLQAFTDTLEQLGDDILREARSLRFEVASIQERLGSDLARPPVAAQKTSTPRQAPVPPAPSLGSKGKSLGDSAPSLGAKDDEAADVQLDAGALRILKTLAERSPVKFTRSQVATLCDYKATGGRFQSLMSALKKAAVVEERNGLVAVTDAGMARARAEGVTLKTNGPFDLQEMWRAALAPAERKLFDALAEVRAEGLTRQELAERTGYEASGGRFQSLLSVLRQNDLVEVQGGHVRLAVQFLYDHEDPRGSKL
jgi:hypothetical protein